MRVVYVAHALTGADMVENREHAKAWVRFAFEQGFSPVADWLLLTSMYYETHRAQGLRADCALVRRCDELWLCGSRLSPGMQIEAEHAREHGVPVVDFTALGIVEPGVGLGVKLPGLRLAAGIEEDR